MREHAPVSEIYMQYVYPKYTICQVLRDIYHKSTDPDVRLQLRIAVSMAKSMSRKLREYNKKWDESFWDKNDGGST